VVPASVFVLGRRGYTLIELIAVVGIIGVVTATSVPWMISYWRSAALRAGAEELAAGLNNGRQLAISQAQPICVEVLNNQFRYRLVNCAGAVWAATGAGANGFFRLANNMGVTANGNLIFDYLGAATPAATLTVTNPQGGATLSVVVSPAGRVRICPTAGCP
jgi:type II secretion system protein H